MSERRALRRIAIVQPAVPEYRIPFFAELRTAAADDIEIDVFSGETPSQLRARNDTVRSPLVRMLPTRELRIGSRTVLFRSPREVIAGHYDLVILEHAARNLETYIFLARLGRRHIAFWGHGKTYTKDIPASQERLKYWLARRGRWYFGYTQRGIDAVVAHGVSRERTTVLNNSIDTEALRADLAAVSPEQLQDFEMRHDLRGHTALYVGALDTYKRIPFLIDAAITAHGQDEDFRLLIVGDGAERFLIEHFATENPWATYLGSLRGPDKALALRAAQAIAIPGAIGLVALDSLVAGVPIVTTRYPHHGPEFDYLRPGITAIVTVDDVDAYAQGLIDFLRDEPRRLAFSASALAEASNYSLRRMVDNYLDGLHRALCGA